MSNQPDGGVRGIDPQAQMTSGKGIPSLGPVPRPMPAPVATDQGRSGTVTNRHGRFGYVIWRKPPNELGMHIKLEFIPAVANGQLGFLQTWAETVGGAPFLRTAADVPASAYFHNRILDTGGRVAADPLDEEEPRASRDPITNDGTRKWNTQGIRVVDLIDGPGIPIQPGYAPDKKSCAQRFETAALAMSGPEKGRLYGCATWGWSTDANEAFRFDNVVARDEVTDDFLGATRNFLRVAYRNGPQPFTAPSRGDAVNPNVRKRLLEVAQWLTVNAESRGADTDVVWLVASGPGFGSRGDRKRAAMLALQRFQTTLGTMKVPASRIRLLAAEPESVATISPDTVDVIVLDRGIPSMPVFKGR